MRAISLRLVRLVGPVQIVSRLTLALAVALAAAPLTAQDDEPIVAGGDGTGESGWSFDWGLEVKGNYRDSELKRLPSPFAFPGFFLPPGASQAFLETVDEGEHTELSAVTLSASVAKGDRFLARIKVDGVDRYDRNPTSSDNDVDVDELWLRFGPDPASIPERASAYLKLGKFEHFERQNDRHLESYGLISTAFNRFEDAGVELGAAFGRHLYVKVSYTQGNPIFFRDPNALAGDNGTPELDPFANPNPNPDLKSGFPILYDAEIEDVDFDDPETGLGIGLRFGEPGSGRELNLLAWSYRRDLADTVDLTGTFYGGDLDLLDGPLAEAGVKAGLPIVGRKKEEVGANLWLYLGGFSLFGQYVDSELAGLDREGYEVELAWRWDLPLGAAVGGKQLFPSIQPAVRFSYLDPDIVGGGPFPGPSVRWEWEKLDYGLRIVVVEGIDLTVEYADHEFTLANGTVHSNNELLGTLRWRL